MRRQAAASKILTRRRDMRHRNENRPHIASALAERGLASGYRSYRAVVHDRYRFHLNSSGAHRSYRRSGKYNSGRRRVAAIEQKLADLEAKSGIQLVVATVTSLEGQEIEPYANELFRNWKLGEKTKNNGVLLLVAPNERRVRIEVGYGLEGTLTDALSKVIITNAITPRFKTGDFSGGISRGVDDIITVLTTDASEWQQRPSLRLDNQPTTDPTNWLLIAAMIVLVTLLIVSPGFRWFFLEDGAEYYSQFGQLEQQWRIFERRRLFGRRGVVGRRRGFGELVMSISNEDHERIASAIRSCRGKDLGRNRLRAGADILPRNGIAGSYCRGSRARAAMVADDLHRDDGSPDFIAAGYRIFSAFDAPLFAARPGRAYAT